MIDIYLNSVIGDAILKAIYTTVWGMFIQGPLQLISQFNQILVWLASGVIFALIFGNKKLDGTDTFTFSGIPSVFWGFCILAFFVLVVIFMIQYFKIIHSDVAKMKPALFEALKGSGKALLFIFIISFAFFVANELIVFLNNGTQMIFGAQNANIADVLYHLGDAGWDGTSGAPSNYGVPGNVLDYNMFIQIIGTYFFVYALIMTGLALTGKVIELFILFITGPIVFAKMPNDGGQAAGVWKNLCITKLIASWGTLTSYSCFTMAISLLLKNGLSDFSEIGRIVAMLFFVCGGAVSILGVSAMIANFVGESVGAMEGAASLRSTIAAGGMMFAASRKAGQILGFGKNAVNVGGQKRGFFSKMFGRPGGGPYDSQDFSRTDSGGISEFVIPRNSFQNRTGLMAAVGSTIYPGLFSNEDLPTEELKMLNSVNNVNNNSDLETQKQILELEKEKLAMQLELERLKESSNKVETNSIDSKINKLMSWGYSKEKASKVSDEDFEKLEYWYNKDRKFFNDLLEIELNINYKETVQESL